MSIKLIKNWWNVAPAPNYPTGGEGKEQAFGQELIQFSMCNAIVICVTPHIYNWQVIS